jgi:DNA-binding transcriptional ArsR family regulator
MGGKELVELTNKVYKQTLLFPKKEPLRYKIREAADEILKSVIEWEASNTKDSLFEIDKNLQVIKAYFNVAKWQNWVSYFDILKIELEYDKIRDYFSKQEIAGKLKQAIIAKKEKKVAAKPLNSRKKKILDILKQREKVQVSDVKEIIGDVSKRTLRRDFDDLLKQNLVERVGESNSTYYKLHSVS